MLEAFVKPGTLGGTPGIYAIATDGSGQIVRLDMLPCDPPYVDFVGAVSGTVKHTYTVYLSLVEK